MKNHQVSVYEVCEMFAHQWLERAAEYCVFENRDAMYEGDVYAGGFDIVSRQYGYPIEIKEFVQQYLMSEYVLKIKAFIGKNAIDIDECLKRSEIPVTRAQYDIA